MEYAQKARMQRSDECWWYLLKSGEDEFAVQYTGPDPDKVFPVDMDGTYSLHLALTWCEDEELMNIVEELYLKALQGREYESDPPPLEVPWDSIPADEDPHLNDKFVENALNQLKASAQGLILTSAELERGNPRKSNPQTVSPQFSMMDPATIIGTVVSLTKGLATVIDSISTLIERRNVDRRMFEIYENLTLSLSRDLISIRRCAGAFRYTNGTGSVSSPAPCAPVELEYWMEIKNLEDKLGGYLEEFKWMLEEIPDNRRWWMPGNGAMEKYERVQNLEKKFTSCRENMKFILSCLIAIQTRSASNESLMPRQQFLREPRISTTSVSSITSESSIGSRSTIPSVISAATVPKFVPLPSPRSEPPVLIRVPSIPSIADIDLNGTSLTRSMGMSSQRTKRAVRPLLRPTKPRTLKCFKGSKFDFLRISASGRSIAFLTRRTYSILTLDYHNLDQAPTAVLTKTGPKKPPSSSATLGHFGCAALNDDCLCIGSPTGEILVVPLAKEMTAFKMVVGCDAIGLMEFSRDGKELLVLGRNKDCTIHHAFIYSVETLNGNPNLRLVGNPMRWREHHGRRQTLASFSEDATYIAIATSTGTMNGHAQIRLLTKDGNNRWCERLRTPLEICVEDLGRRDCRPNCRITAINLYGPELYHF